jgi:DNA-binding NtrC family response regulator
VLEERTIQRLGGEQLIPIDVRVIAATHRDLRAAVDAGSFREDLYFRLSVLVAEIPPLRDRPEDIAPLANDLLARLRSRTSRRVAGFAPTALESLRAYAWPGNIRELRNVVERAVMLGRSERIELGDLPADIRAADRSGAAPSEQVPLPMDSAELDRRNLLAALAATGGNKTRAAAILGIDRVTLYSRLKAIHKDSA